MYLLVAFSFLWVSELKTSVSLWFWATGCPQSMPCGPFHMAACFFKFRRETLHGRYNPRTLPCTCYHVHPITFAIFYTSHRFSPHSRGGDYVRGWSTEGHLWGCSPLLGMGRLWKRGMYLQRGIEKHLEVLEYLLLLLCWSFHGCIHISKPITLHNQICVVYCMSVISK